MKTINKDTLARRGFLKKSALLLPGLMSGVLDANGISKSHSVTVTQFQMGMLVKLTVFTENHAAAYNACKKTFQYIRELVRIFSDHEPASELSRLCARAGTGPCPVSHELMTVLLCATEHAQATDGVFDPTIGCLTRLWRQARIDGRPPAQKAINDALKRSDYMKLILNKSEQTVELLQPGMRLDLGSIAKGYIGDQAVRSLRQQGFPCAAFHAGGDIVVGNAPKNTKGWEIDLPGKNVAKRVIRNKAISISGETYQYLDYEGKRYSHVINPDTGTGLVRSSPYVVEGPNGLHADALATLGSLLPDDQFRLVSNNSA